MEDKLEALKDELRGVLGEAWIPHGEKG